MAVELIDTKEEAKALLKIARDRGIITRISDLDNMFKDPTFFLKESSLSALFAFSDRGTYFEWNWGTIDSRPTRAVAKQIIKDVLIAGVAEANTRWGYGPTDFSFFYNEFCPTVVENSDSGANLVIADLIVEAMNELRPGFAIRFNPPKKVIIHRPGLSTNLGEVYAVSKILKYKDRELDVTGPLPPWIEVT